jgi:L-lactate dehydrogenase complex protein LldG
VSAGSDVRAPDVSGGPDSHGRPDVSGGPDLTEAREAILRRVGAALRAAPTPAPVTREYRRGGPAGGAALVELLHERLVDYRAEVRHIGAGEVGRTVADVCREQCVRRLGVPPGLPADWRPAGISVVEDDGLGPHELDALDGVVTGCTLAIAETGTLVLTAAPAEGRRALTLVPDLYLCVVEERQVVSDLPTALPAIAALVRAERRPVTFISGPSATSDIELHRVAGVHGPRRLVVLIVGAPVVAATVNEEV